MRLHLETVFSRYGTAMTHARSKKVFRGFLQPYRSRARDGIQSEYVLQGKITGRRWILIAPAQAELAENDVVILQKRRYSIRRIEPVWAGDTVAYLWGICTEEGSTQAWES